MRIALPIALLLSATGCEKSRQLSSEAAAAVKETAQIQAELENKRQELGRAIQEYEDLRAQPAMKDGASGSLQEQVKVLTEKKQALESEVASLRGQQEAYRKANP